MDKSVAVKKLRQAIGKGFGYRENPRAGTREDREKAKSELKVATAERQRLKDAIYARERELHMGDEQWLTLQAAYKEAGKRTSTLSGKAHYHRITVGHSESIGGFGFFHVKAEGDNWQEVLDKVTK